MVRKFYLSVFYVKPTLDRKVELTHPDFISFPVCIQFGSVCVFYSRRSHMFENNKER